MRKVITLYDQFWIVLNSFDQFWPLSTSFDHFRPVLTSFDKSWLVFKPFFCLGSLHFSEGGHYCCRPVWYFPFFLYFLKSTSIFQTLCFTKINVQFLSRDHSIITSAYFWLLGPPTYVSINSTINQQNYHFLTPSTHCTSLLM